MKIHYKIKNISKKIIILTGNHYSGKSLFADYMRCFTGIEILNKNPNITLVNLLNYLKKLNLSTSAFLVKNFVNNDIFANSKGRNINLRINDESSLFNYGYPEIYFNRMMSSNFKVDKKNFSIFDVHNAVLNYKLFNLALNNPYFIHFERHPIDLVMDNFLNKTMLQRKNNEYVQILLIKKKNKLFPCYLNKTKHFQNPIDLTIEVICKIFNQTQKNLDILSKNNKKLLILKLEEFKSNPIPNISKIKRFLKIETNKALNKTLSREYLSLDFILKKREKNLKKIIQIASNQQIKKIIKISKIYEKKLT